VNTRNDKRGEVPDLIIGPVIKPALAKEYSSPMVARRVAVLEREAPAMVNLGRSAGVDITYEGIAPMFNQAMVYVGTDTDWVIGPMGTDEAPVVPREQQRVLARLEEAGAHFPAIYVAHEVEKGQLPDSPYAPTGSMALVSTEEARDLVGPPPLPVQSVELAERLNVRATQVFRAMRTAAVVTGTAAAAAVAVPFALVGAAVGSLATLDPIVFGVVPAVSPREGEPAAWYVLARWDW
jgi:hypothetical protein